MSLRRILWMAGGPRGDGITTGTTSIQQVQPGPRKGATRYAGRHARGSAVPGCAGHEDRDGKQDAIHGANSLDKIRFFTAVNGCNNSIHWVFSASSCQASRRYPSLQM